MGLTYRKAERVVLIFVDGLGVGLRDPAKNPMARVMGRYLRVFSGENGYAQPHGGIAQPLDTLLGVEGIPQSATGQTALLTGINASKILGYHLFGFPNRTLREIILKHSLLKKVHEAGLRPAFLNAFRPKFFEMGEAVWEKRRMSVTSWVNRAAGLPFFSLEDVKRGRSIYQDFTNGALREQGYDVPLFTPEKAGAILARESVHYDLTLYEYFRTDVTGHSQEMARAEEEIHRIETFLEAFHERIDLEKTAVILTSDHGNIEDLSVRSHTRNRALTLLWGVGSKEVAEKIDSILDVSDRILGLLGVPKER